MKTKPISDGKPFDRFRAFTKKVVSVPQAEIDKRAVKWEARKTSDKALKPS